MFAEDRELREPEGRVLSDAHHGSAQFLLPRLQSAQRRARVSHSAAERQTRPVRDPRQPRAEQGVSTAGLNMSRSSRDVVMATTGQQTPILMSFSSWSFDEASWASFMRLRSLSRLFLAASWGQT